MSNDVLKKDLQLFVKALASSESSIQPELKEVDKLLDQSDVAIEMNQKNIHEAREEVCLFLTKIEKAAPDLLQKKQKELQTLTKKHCLDDPIEITLNKRPKTS